MAFPDLYQSPVRYPDPVPYKGRVSRRRLYERASLIITADLAFGEWSGVSATPR
jgi:hypothetical protein